MAMMRAHPRCIDWQTGDYVHICHQPSGKECFEDGCTEPAGTLWTPHWCPDHDVERIDRISAQLLGTQEELRAKKSQPDT